MLARFQNPLLCQWSLPLNYKYSIFVPLACIKKILLNSIKIDGKQLLQLIYSTGGWCTLAIWKTKVIKAIQQNIFRFHLLHRVLTEWQWPLSGVHSILMEKSAQPGEGGGARPSPTPFHYIYFYVYKVVVYAPVEREDTKPYFHSTPMCTMWFAHRDFRKYSLVDNILKG